MKYALLVYEDERQFDPDKSGPHLKELVGKHMAFTQELGAKRIGGAGLKGTSTATTVRTQGDASSSSFFPLSATRSPSRLWCATPKHGAQRESTPKASWCP